MRKCHSQKEKKKRRRKRKGGGPNTVLPYVTNNVPKNDFLCTVLGSSALNPLSFLEKKKGKKGGGKERKKERGGGKTDKFAIMLLTYF